MSELHEKYSCRNLLNRNLLNGNKTRSSADADKLMRHGYRSVKVTKHSTIPHVTYSFLLV